MERTEAPQPSTPSFMEADSNNMPQIPVNPEVDPINPPEDSEQSKMFDRLIEESQNGSISLSPQTRALVPDVPDYLYKSRTEGWEHNNNGYVSESNNASRDIGYTIYHMPDIASGNALNYVMRF